MNDSSDEKISDPQLAELEERLRSLKVLKMQRYETELVNQSQLRRRSFQRKTSRWGLVFSTVGTVIGIFVSIFLFQFRLLIHEHSSDPPQGNPGHVSQIIEEPSEKSEKFKVSTVRQQLGMMFDEIQNEKPIELKKPVYRIVEIPLEKRKEPQLQRERNENVLRAKTLRRNDFESLFL